MPNYIRQGTCNWCGQCCGAPYSYGGAEPIKESPWPISWPEGLRTWSETAFSQHFVWRTLISKGSFDTKSGRINWRGFRPYFIFVDGYSLCLDLPPYGTATTPNVDFIPRCPALILHGESSTPPTECGLAPDCEVWTNHCQSKPPSILSEDYKILWEESFPACSYTWVLE